MVECTLHTHVNDFDCFEFRDEIPFKEGRMLDPRNFNLWKNGKIVISIIKLPFRLKIYNLSSRSWMMKQIAPLESSRKI